MCGNRAHTGSGVFGMFRESNAQLVRCFRRFLIFGVFGGFVRLERWFRKVRKSSFILHENRVKRVVWRGCN